MDQPTDTAPPGPAPSAPPDGPPGPRRLRRRPDDGHVAGVCAGVAEYFAVDPVIVRVVAVVLLFAGPGAFAYVLAWIFVPAAEGSVPHGSPQAPIDRSDRATQVFGIALIVLAASVFWGDWWSPGREWFLPIGLVALGAWLLFRRDEPGTDPAPPPPAPPATAHPLAWASTPDASWSAATAAPDPTVEGPTTAAWDPTVEGPTAAAPDSSVEAATAAWDASGPPPPPLGATAAVPEPAPPPAPRRRRIVRPIVFGTLLVWTGVAFLAGVTVQTGLAVAVLIVGAGFLLGAAVGGSRALIGPAVLLVLLLVATTVLDIPLTGPIGDREWAPQRTEDVEASYEVSLGQGSLDLTALRVSEGDELEVDASVGIGSLRVLVPQGADVTVVTELGAGSAEIFGVQQSGFGVADEHFEEGRNGAVHLDLHVGVGEIDVERGR